MTCLEAYKVVTAAEMAMVEKRSIEKGASAESYMIKAGEGIATCVEVFTEAYKREKKCTLLVGKGNNGGDAYVAGTRLLERGFLVKAFHLYKTEESSPLSQKHEQLFKKAGGEVMTPSSTNQIRFFSNGIILDGLLGTGFQGKVEKFMVEVIDLANHSHIPILAIDIPSGVNGNTGKVDPIAIQATETITLGLPKLGCFLGQGFNYIGGLSVIDFGMDVEFINQANAFAHLLSEKNIMSLLPSIKRTRHKYQSGYVVALAGSYEMPGAALLSCLSTLRSGAGIVRLFTSEEMGGKLSGAPYEVICSPFHTDRFFEEIKRAGACLIGPGLGRKPETATLLQNVLPNLDLPCVIDADGLYHLPPLLKKLPATAILTPHHKEMLRLLGKDAFPENGMLSVCQQFTEENQVTLILKGAPTILFHPQTPPLIILRGDPGMATAGTGDVLTGMVAAFLAQKLPPRQAAALAIYLHGCAGEYAARRKTSYSMIATDLIEALPEVLRVQLMLECPMGK